MMGRRKYKFDSRESAERAEFDRSIESLRNYFAAICYQSQAVPEKFRSGSWRMEVFTIHPYSGREFSLGPIGVLFDDESTCPPTIVDAWNWSHEAATSCVTPSDDAGLNRRDLAEQVRRGIARQESAA